MRESQAKELIVGGRVGFDRVILTVILSLALVLYFVENSAICAVLLSLMFSNKPFSDESVRISSTSFMPS
jgi:hypothetical protein